MTYGTAPALGESDNAASAWTALAQPALRAMFLQLAQKWLEMANSRFGLTSRNRDRLDSAPDKFNEAK